MKYPFSIRTEFLIAAALAAFLAYDIHQGDAPDWKLETEAVAIFLFLIPGLVKWHRSRTNRNDGLSDSTDRTSSD